jgi:hypothetical protein
MSPPLVLGFSLVAGFCAGLLVHRGTPLRGADSAKVSSAVGERGNTAEGGAVAGEKGIAVRGVAEGESFSVLPLERQKEVLVRLGTKISRGGSTGDQLLLAETVGKLDFDQAATLLAKLPKEEEGAKTDPLDGTRSALAERLAALNPGRVLEMGKTAGDPKLAQAAVVAIAQKSGADAIRAIAQLPDKFQSAVVSEMKGSFNDGLARASGSIESIAAVLKENPKLMDPKAASEGAVRRILGQVASQAAAQDPAAAMADVRRLAAGLVEVKPGEDPKAAESALVARIGSQMTKAMRSDAPQSERVVFDSLADTEKNDVQVALEAVARFRTGGVEEAIRFAEKQSKEQFTKNAAGGVWWSLAQRDRPAAMQWIESLPPGPFRDGALNSFMQEASFRTRSWGDSGETVRAGAEFLSKSSKLDYFTMLAGQSRGTGISRSEFIASLPLPEGDKAELRRRLAPIRPK